MQAGAISFHRITTGDGLSHGTVLDACQDPKGRMWFATRDGLNSFDGYDVRIYRHSDSDSNTLADNSVRGVMTDRDGILWVTSAWLSRYDDRTGKFENFITPSHRHIQCISDFTSGKLLVACSDSLYCFDKDRMCFDSSVLPSRMRTLDVRAMCLLSDEILMGTKDGRLYRWNIATNDINILPLKSDNILIKDIICDRDEIWIATEGNGIFHSDLSFSSIEHFTAGHSGLMSNYVRSLCYDTQGRLWIGTNAGLQIYDRGSFTSYVHERTNPFSISDNSIRTIYRDHQGGMWVGTYNDALNWWHPYQYEFSYMYPSYLNPKITGDKISCITGDSEGFLWMGIGWDGVMKYNPRTREMSYYSILSNRDREANIKSIWCDDEYGKVYFASQFGGLDILDRHTGRLSSKDNIPSDVFDIAHKDEDTLFLCTSSGLYLIDRKSGKVKHEDRYRGHRNIKSIHKDSEGKLWIGGSYGMQVYTDDSSFIEAEIDFLDKVSRVTSFHESDSGDIYIVTEYGLYCYNQQKKEFLFFNTENGLPNNVVKCIVEDKNGMIWIGTDNGLCRYNPFSSTFKSYGSKEGLICSRFSDSAYILENGTLFFGTFEGLISFNPANMLENPFCPQPQIMTIVVSGEEVFPEEGCIAMDWRDNSLTVKLSAMNYLSEGRDSFAYRLKGYDEEWHNITASNTLTYPKLPHGRYTLEVMAANNEGIWNEGAVSLEIIVRPIWTQTVWAKIAAALVVLSFFILGAYLVFRKREQRHMEELHQMKLNFFINFLNELKTPLTLIISPLQELIFRSDSRWMQRQLRYIEKNSRRLVHLVDQMIDFRKAELGVISLKVCRTGVAGLAEDIISCYEGYARHKKLKISFLPESDDMQGLLDRQYFDIILNNLLSNAFRFTREGSVVVRLYLADDQLILEVKDTGIGLSEEEVRNLMSGPNMPVSNHLGAGMGLSLVNLLVKQHHGTLNIVSEKGKGSSFMIGFPQDESVYDAGERIDESSYYPVLQEIDIPDPDMDDAMGSTSSASKKVRMLIYEKDPQMLNYLIEKFSAVFDVMSVDDVEQAFSMLKENELDVVVADADKIHGAGMKLCARIKQDMNTSHIPVIIISSTKDARNQLEAFQMGADDFIAKPFSLPALSVKISNILKTYSHSRIHSMADMESGRFAVNDLDEDFLRKAMDIVEKNISNESFTTADFAREIGMSQSNLYIKLKALTGDSALNFILGVRFREACRLLKDGKYNISEISEKVGFSSPSYFSRAFRRYYGIMPSEYSKNNI